MHAIGMLLVICGSTSIRLSLGTISGANFGMPELRPLVFTDRLTTQVRSGTL
ncbi:hypothetical protein SV7mr_26860 [Stieleria bergensis]|uniref:Uncharacterized protein n=1 Tax=Stieleria bergensis TaxID=2528025 RepID=A0A517SVK7_9BACT|nr:hypothetical protein SV7mr_26860 [Planctomycetes bacterium SV_7m_r]